MLRKVTVAMGLAALVLVVAPCRGQNASPNAPGAFVGTIKNALDKSPVKAADVRLYFVDSGRVVKDPLGISTVETYVDTTRSRLGFTDSTGNFAIWHLSAGKYLMNIRRIGFSPVEAVVTVDTETVIFDYAMDPTSRMLSKVEIVEAASTSATRRLEATGFDRRSHMGSGQLIKGLDLTKHQPQTLKDILDFYGVRDGGADFLLDRMPLEYDDIQDYPAEFIAGIEIYRHNRPPEFNGTRGTVTRIPRLGRGGRGAPSSQALFSRPLVVIWTAFP